MTDEHNHITRDIKPPGECPACDHYHEGSPDQWERAKAKLQQMAAETACPACGHDGMTMTWRLRAKPVGSFSLSGASMKFSANEVPYIECPACGIGTEGSI